MRIESLIESLPESYSSADRELVQRAYRTAEQAHTNKRALLVNPISVTV